MLNETPNLDAIQNEAAKSSIAPEEVDANAVSTTPESNANQDGKKETSVQENVKNILNKARKNDASPEGDETPEDEPTSPDSSPETEDKTTEKETDGQEEADKVDGEQEATDDDDGKENENEETPEQKEARETKEREEAEKSSQDALKVPDEKLPFHKHPRFQQLIHENQSLKPKAHELDSIHKYRQDNQIDQDTFNQALTLAALSKKNPQEFVSTLRKLCDEQEVQLGIKLPTDLAQRVEKGELSERDAKEISTLRIEKQQREQGVKTQTARAEQERVTSVVNSLNSVGADLMKKDPSFRPKTNGGPDGVYEFALKSFTMLQAQTPAKNGMEAAQQFTQCYNEVKALISSHLPRRQANRNFVSASQRNSNASGLTPSSRRNGDSANASVTDSVNSVLKKHGLKIRPPSQSNGEE